MSQLIALALWITLQTPIDNWKTIVLPGGYSVDAPCELVEVSKGLGEETMPAGCRMWLGLDSGAAYTVLVGKMSPEETAKTAPDRVLSNVVFGMLESRVKGEIRAQRDILFNGWPGIEVEVVGNPSLRAKTRTFVIRDTILQLAAIWKEPGFAPAGLSRFLDSMLIPKSAGRGPQQSAGPSFTICSLPEGKISVRLPSKPERTVHTFGSQDHPGTMIRFEADYGNRMYICAYFDLPDEAMADLADHERDLLQTVNGNAIEAAKGKGQHDVTYDFEKHTVLSSTAKLAGGGLARVDSFVRDNRVYLLMVEAPEPLMQTDEVKLFFSSIKLE
ncbi:MAG: hypothetical protein ACHQ50_09335 [Fimbriimonadales bacterium]